MRWCFCDCADVDTGPTYDNLSAETVAASGVGLFAEKLDGIVIGTIGAGA